MKVILVFDKPNYCYDCPCYYEDKDKCEVFNKRAIADIGIPSWCPLRPLPTREKFNKYFDSYDNGFFTGWNACLDEITGETEC